MIKPDAISQSIGRYLQTFKVGSGFFYGKSLKEGVIAKSGDALQPALIFR
jgi:hypothetical protein